MKKITLTAAALFVLAGSTFAVASTSTNHAPVAKTSKKTVVNVVPSCPPGDPNGCGIFD